MRTRKELETYKKKLEAQFNSLTEKIGQLGEEQRNVRCEQIRFQGEYRLITRLLEE